MDKEGGVMAHHSEEIAVESRRRISLTVPRFGSLAMRWAWPAWRSLFTVLSRFGSHHQYWKRDQYPWVFGLLSMLLAVWLWRTGMCTHKSRCAQRHLPIRKKKISSTLWFIALLLTAMLGYAFCGYGARTERTSDATTISV